MGLIRHIFGVFAVGRGSGGGSLRGGMSGGGMARGDGRVGVRRQRGFVHLIFLVFVVMGVALWGVSVTLEKLYEGEDRVAADTRRGLEEARRSLLEYTVVPPRGQGEAGEYLFAEVGRFWPAGPVDISVAYTRGFSEFYLPCPDTLVDDDFDGVADISSISPGCADIFGAQALAVGDAAEDGSRLGRLPWREKNDGIESYVRGLAAGDPRDGFGGRLWYAVSRELVRADVPHNPHRLARLSRATGDALLRVEDPTGELVSDRVAAVIIAPGLAPAESEIYSHLQDYDGGLNIDPEDFIGVNARSPDGGRDSSGDIDISVGASVGVFLRTPPLSYDAGDGDEFIGVTHDRVADGSDQIAMVEIDELVRGPESFGDDGGALPVRLLNDPDSPFNIYGRIAGGEDYLDAVEALRNFYDRNGYFPEPAAFDARHGDSVERLWMPYPLAEGAATITLSPTSAYISKPPQDRNVILQLATGASGIRLDMTWGELLTANGYGAQITLRRGALPGFGFPGHPRAGIRLTVQGVGGVDRPLTLFLSQTSFGLAFCRPGDITAGGCGPEALTTGSERELVFDVEDIASQDVSIPSGVFGADNRLNLPSLESRLYVERRLQFGHRGLRFGGGRFGRTSVTMTTRTFTLSTDPAMTGFPRNTFQALITDDYGCDLFTRSVDGGTYGKRVTLFLGRENVINFRDFSGAGTSSRYDSNGDGDITNNAPTDALCPADAEMTISILEGPNLIGNGGLSPEFTAPDGTVFDRQPLPEDAQIVLPNFYYSGRGGFSCVDDDGDASTPMVASAPTDDPLTTGDIREDNPIYLLNTNDPQRGGPNPGAIFNALNNNPPGLSDDERNQLCEDVSSTAVVRTTPVTLTASIGEVPPLYVAAGDLPPVYFASSVRVGEAISALGVGERPKAPYNTRIVDVENDLHTYRLRDYFNYPDFTLAFTITSFAVDEERVEGPREFAVQGSQQGEPSLLTSAVFVTLTAGFQLRLSAPVHSAQQGPPNKYVNCLEKGWDDISPEAEAACDEDYLRETPAGGAGVLVPPGSILDTAATVTIGSYEYEVLAVMFFPAGTTLYFDGSGDDRVLYPPEIPVPVRFTLEASDPAAPPATARLVVAELGEGTPVVSAPVGFFPSGRLASAPTEGIEVRDWDDDDYVVLGDAYYSAKFPSAVTLVYSRSPGTAASMAIQPHSPGGWHDGSYRDITLSVGTLRRPAIVGARYGNFIWPSQFNVGDMTLTVTVVGGASVVTVQQALVVAAGAEFLLPPGARVDLGGDFVFPDDTIALLPAGQTVTAADFPAAVVRLPNGILTDGARRQNNVRLPLGGALFAGGAAVARSVGGGVPPEIAAFEIELHEWADIVDADGDDGANPNYDPPGIAAGVRAPGFKGILLPLHSRLLETPELRLEPDDVLIAHTRTRARFLASPLGYRAIGFADNLTVLLDEGCPASLECLAAFDHYAQIQAHLVTLASQFALGAGDYSLRDESGLLVSEAMDALGAAVDLPDLVGYADERMDFLLPPQTEISVQYGDLTLTGAVMSYIGDEPDFTDGGGNTITLTAPVVVDESAAITVRDLPLRVALPPNTGIISPTFVGLDSGRVAYLNARLQLELTSPFEYGVPRVDTTVILTTDVDPLTGSPFLDAGGNTVTQTVTLTVENTPSKRFDRTALEYRSPEISRSIVTMLYGPSRHGDSISSPTPGAPFRYLDGDIDPRQARFATFPYKWEDQNGVEKVCPGAGESDLPSLGECSTPAARRDCKVYMGSRPGGETHRCLLGAGLDTVSADPRHNRFGPGMSEPPYALDRPFLVPEPLLPDSAFVGVGYVDPDTGAVVRSAANYPVAAQIKMFDREVIDPRAELVSSVPFEVIVTLGVGSLHPLTNNTLAVHPAFPNNLIELDSAGTAVGTLSGGELRIPANRAATWQRGGQTITLGYRYFRTPDGSPCPDTACTAGPPADQAIVSRAEPFISYPTVTTRSVVYPDGLRGAGYQIRRLALFPDTDMRLIRTSDGGDKLTLKIPGGSVVDLAEGKITPPLARRNFRALAEDSEVSFGGPLVGVVREDFRLGPGDGALSDETPDQQNAVWWWDLNTPAASFDATRRPFAANLSDPGCDPEGGGQTVECPPLSKLLDGEGILLPRGALLYLPGGHKLSIVAGGHSGGGQSPALFDSALLPPGAVAFLPDSSMTVTVATKVTPSLDLVYPELGFVTHGNAAGGAVISGPAALEVGGRQVRMFDIERSFWLQALGPSSADFLSAFNPSRAPLKSSFAGAAVRAGDDSLVRLLAPNRNVDLSGNVDEYGVARPFAELLSPDTASFLENYPLIYAVAEECRRHRAGGIAGAPLGDDVCAADFGEGLRVRVEPDEEVALSSDMIAPPGVFIVGDEDGSEPFTATYIRTDLAAVPFTPEMLATITVETGGRPVVVPCNPNPAFGRPCVDCVELSFPLLDTNIVNNIIGADEHPDSDGDGIVDPGEYTDIPANYGKQYCGKDLPGIVGGPTDGNYSLGEANLNPGDLFITRNQTITITTALQQPGEAAIPGTTATFTLNYLAVADDGRLVGQNHRPGGSFDIDAFPHSSDHQYSAFNEWMIINGGVAYLYAVDVENAGGTPAVSLSSPYADSTLTEIRDATRVSITTTMTLFAGGFVQRPGRRFQGPLEPPKATLALLAGSSFTLGAGANLVTPRPGEQIFGVGGYADVRGVTVTLDDYRVLELGQYQVTAQGGVLTLDWRGVPNPVGDGDVLTLGRASVGDAAFFVDPGSTSLVMEPGYTWMGYLDGVNTLSYHRERVTTTIAPDYSFDRDDLITMVAAIEATATLSEMDAVEYLERIGVDSMEFNYEASLTILTTMPIGAAIPNFDERLRILAPRVMHPLSGLAARPVLFSSFLNPERGTPYSEFNPYNDDVDNSLWFSNYNEAAVGAPLSTPPRMSGDRASEDRRGRGYYEIIDRYGAPNIDEPDGSRTVTRLGLEQGTGTFRTGMFFRPYPNDPLSNFPWHGGARALDLMHGVQISLTLALQDHFNQLDDDDYRAGTRGVPGQTFFSGNIGQQIPADCLSLFDSDRLSDSDRPFPADCLWLVFDSGRPLPLLISASIATLAAGDSVSSPTTGLDDMEEVLNQLGCEYQSIPGACIGSLPTTPSGAGLAVTLGFAFDYDRVYTFTVVQTATTTTVTLNLQIGRDARVALQSEEFDGQYLREGENEFEFLISLTEELTVLAERRDFHHEHHHLQDTVVNVTVAGERISPLPSSGRDAIASYEVTVTFGLSARERRETVREYGDEAGGLESDGIELAAALYRAAGGDPDGTLMISGAGGPAFSVQLTAQGAGSREIFGDGNPLHFLRHRPVGPLSFAGDPDTPFYLTDLLAIGGTISYTNVAFLGMQAQPPPGIASLTLGISPVRVTMRLPIFTVTLLVNRGVGCDTNGDAYLMRNGGDLIPGDAGECIAVSSQGSGARPNLRPSDAHTFKTPGVVGSIETATFRQFLDACSLVTPVPGGTPDRVESIPLYGVDGDGNPNFSPNRDTGVYCRIQDRFVDSSGNLHQRNSAVNIRQLLSSEPAYLGLNRYVPVSLDQLRKMEMIPPPGTPMGEEENLQPMPGDPDHWYAVFVTEGPPDPTSRNPAINVGDYITRTEGMETKYIPGQDLVLGWQHGRVSPDARATLDVVVDTAKIDPAYPIGDLYFLGSGFVQGRVNLGALHSPLRLKPDARVAAGEYGVSPADDVTLAFNLQSGTIPADDHGYALPVDLKRLLDSIIPSRRASVVVPVGVGDTASEEIALLPPQFALTLAKPVIGPDKPIAITIRQTDDTTTPADLSRYLSWLPLSPQAAPGAAVESLQTITVFGGVPTTINFEFDKDNDAPQMWTTPPRISIGFVHSITDRATGSPVLGARLGDQYNVTSMADGTATTATIIGALTGMGVDSLVIPGTVTARAVLRENQVRYFGPGVPFTILITEYTYGDPDLPIDTSEDPLRLFELISHILDADVDDGTALTLPLNIPADLNPLQRRRANDVSLAITIGLHSPDGALTTAITLAPRALSEVSPLYLNTSRRWAYFHAYPTERISILVSEISGDATLALDWSAGYTPPQPAMTIAARNFANDVATFRATGVGADFDMMISPGAEWRNPVDALIVNRQTATLEISTNDIPKGYYAPLSRDELYREAAAAGISGAEITLDYTPRQDRRIVPAGGDPVEEPLRDIVFDNSNPLTLLVEYRNCSNANLELAGAMWSLWYSNKVAATISVATSASTPPASGSESVRYRWPEGFPRDSGIPQHVNREVVAAALRERGQPGRILHGKTDALGRPLGDPACFDPPVVMEDTLYDSIADIPDEVGEAIALYIAGRPNGLIPIPASVAPADRIQWVEENRLPELLTTYMEEFSPNTCSGLVYQRVNLNNSGTNPGDSVPVSINPTGTDNSTGYFSEGLSLRIRLAPGSGVRSDFPITLRGLDDDGNFCTECFTVGVQGAGTGRPSDANSYSTNPNGPFVNYPPRDYDNSGGAINANDLNHETGRPYRRAPFTNPYSPRIRIGNYNDGRPREPDGPPLLPALPGDEETVVAVGALSITLSAAVGSYDDYFANGYVPGGANIGNAILQGAPANRWIQYYPNKNNWDNNCNEGTVTVAYYPPAPLRAVAEPPLRDARLTVRITPMGDHFVASQGVGGNWSAQGGQPLFLNEYNRFRRYDGLDVGEPIFRTYDTIEEMRMDVVTIAVTFPQLPERPVFGRYSGGGSERVYRCPAIQSATTEITFAIGDLLQNFSLYEGQFAEPVTVGLQGPETSPGSRPGRQVKSGYAPDSRDLDYSFDFDHPLLPAHESGLTIAQPFKADYFGRKEVGPVKNIVTADAQVVLSRIPDPTRAGREKQVLPFGEEAFALEGYAAVEPPIGGEKDPSVRIRDIVRALIHGGGGSQANIVRNYIYPGAGADARPQPGSVAAHYLDVSEHPVSDRLRVNLWTELRRPALDAAAAGGAVTTGDSTKVFSDLFRRDQNLDGDYERITYQHKRITDFDAHRGRPILRGSSYKCDFASEVPSRYPGLFGDLAFLHPENEEVGILRFDTPVSRGVPYQRGTGGSQQENFGAECNREDDDLHAAERHLLQSSTYMIESGYLKPENVRDIEFMMPQPWATVSRLDPYTATTSSEVILAGSVIRPGENQIVPATAFPNAGVLLIEGESAIAAVNGGNAHVPVPIIEQISNPGFTVYLPVPSLTMSLAVGGRNLDVTDDTNPSCPGIVYEGCTQKNPLPQFYTELRDGFGHQVFDHTAAYPGTALSDTLYACGNSNRDVDENPFLYTAFNHQWDGVDYIPRGQEHSARRYFFYRALSDRITVNVELFGYNLTVTAGFDTALSDAWLVNDARRSINKKTIAAAGAAPDVPVDQVFGDPNAFPMRYGHRIEIPQGTRLTIFPNFYNSHLRADVDLATVMVTDADGNEITPMEAAWPGSGKLYPFDAGNADPVPLSVPVYPLPRRGNIKLQRSFAGPCYARNNDGRDAQIHQGLQDYTHTGLSQRRGCFVSRRFYVDKSSRIRSGNRDFRGRTWKGWLTGVLNVGDADSYRFQEHLLAVVNPGALPIPGATRRGVPLDLRTAKRRNPPNNLRDPDYRVFDDVPIRQNLWVRLQAPAVFTSIDGVRITLDEGFIVNPIQGTYVNPAADLAESLPNARTAVVTPAFIPPTLLFNDIPLENPPISASRPAAVFPSGSPVFAAKGGAFENVQAALFFSLYPLNRAECYDDFGVAGARGGGDIIDQRREGVFAPSARPVIGNITGRDGASALAESLDAEIVTAGHPCVYLDDLENTDNDSDFVYRGRGDHFAPDGKIINNDRTFLIGGEFVPDS